MSTLHRPLSEVVDQAVEVAVLRAEFPEIGGLRSGIAGLDEAASEAFAPGSLIVIAGESGRGKTALATQLTVAFASQQPGLWLSLEDAALAAASRMIANVGRVDVGSVRSGKAVLENGEAFDAATAHLAGLDVSVIDDISLTVEAIAASAWQWQRQAGRDGGFIVIDQLSHIARSHGEDASVWARRGLPAPPPVNAPENLILGWQTRVLKAVAMKMGVVIVLFHQLNELHAPGTKPTERSIRGSREITHNSDAVIVPWVPKQVENPFAGPGQPEMVDNILGQGFLLGIKTRSVAPFEVPVRWDGAHQRWADDDGGDLTAAYVPPPAPSARAIEGQRRMGELRARFDAQRDGRLAAYCPVALPEHTGQAPAPQVAAATSPVELTEHSGSYDAHVYDGCDDANEWVIG